jgi:hypothetical protein
MGQLMNDMILLEPGEWGLWQRAAVRAAGFPVDGLELFSDGEDVRLPALPEATIVASGR